MAIFPKYGPEDIDMLRGEVNVVSDPVTTQRCDRCGAQAYVEALLKSGATLTFCAHHGRQYEAELRPQCIEWDDRSNQVPVAEKPANVPA